MPLFREDALYYAEQVKQGLVTVSELVERALLNIEQLNPILRAVSVVQAEDARRLAKQMDRHLATLSPEERQSLPIFYGVPTLLKDLGQEQAGVKSTCGAKLWADYIAPRTSLFAQKWEELGFVIVGRTNTPEFGFKNVSDSQLNGRVSYPGDLTRNAGGSSGGAAAALKAGIVPIVAASDGGGSIRIPASFCGLIGLKPSRGRQPVGPDSYRGWQGAAVNFALTKSMRDTWKLLWHSQVEQYEAPFMVPKLTEPQLILPQRPLKIGYLDQSALTEQVIPDAKKVLDEAIGTLTRLGHQVEHVTLSVDMVQAARDYCLMNAVETAAMMQQIERGIGRALTVDDMELMSWGIYQAGVTCLAADYSLLLSRWDQLAAQLEHVFSEYDVLLTPGANGPAPLHTEFPLSEDISARLLNQADLSVEERIDLMMEMWRDGWSYTPFTFLQNLAGQAAIALPFGKTSTGLPLGIQLWSGKGQETIICQLAYQLEQEGCLDSQIIEM